MSCNGNSLKDWKVTLDKFDYLFRHEYQLLKEGWIIESEFFDAFKFLLLEAIEKISTENKSD